MNATECEALKKRGEELQSTIVAYRRALHAYPELKMDTPQTEAQIVRFLEEMGVDEIQKGVGGHGVSAMIRGELPGKCLAIRADCDGLPIREETGLPFASMNGNMHACGHDSHTAMALGAARLLLERKDIIKGSVKLIFQPYEEGDRGASLMMADGVLENPKVDGIIALHNHGTAGDGRTAGDVLATPEPVSANIFAYQATFHGTGAHVCLSHQSVNPVYMACEAVMRIKDILPETSEAINAVTVIQGGVRNNIIPETCVIEGSIRSFDDEEQRMIRAEAMRIIDEVAAKYGGTVETQVNIDLMSTRIDRSMYDAFVHTVHTVYPEDEIYSPNPRQFIGEDFARFADRIPALYFFLCA